MSQPAPFEGFEVQLGGTVYTVPRLSFKAMRETREQFKALHDRGVDSESLQSSLVDVIHAALTRNYPDLEREVVEDNVDWSTGPAIFSQIMQISAAPGEQKVESPSGESTGTS